MGITSSRSTSDASGSSPAPAAPRGSGASAQPPYIVTTNEPIPVDTGLRVRCPRCTAILVPPAAVFRCPCGLTMSVPPSTSALLRAAQEVGADRNPDSRTSVVEMDGMIGGRPITALVAMPMTREAAAVTLAERLQRTLPTLSNTNTLRDATIHRNDFFENLLRAMLQQPMYETTLFTVQGPRVQRMLNTYSAGATRSMLHLLPTRVYTAPKPPASTTAVREDAAPAAGAGEGAVQARESGGGAGCELPEELRQCGICMLDYEEGDILRTLPCLHFFHRDCVDRWLLEHKTCPVCKTPIDIDPELAAAQWEAAAVDKRAVDDMAAPPPSPSSAGRAGASAAEGGAGVGTRVRSGGTQSRSPQSRLDGGAPSWTQLDSTSSVAERGVRSPPLRTTFGPTSDINTHAVTTP